MDRGCWFIMRVGGILVVGRMTCSMGMERSCGLMVAAIEDCSSTELNKDMDASYGPMVVTMKAILSATPFPEQAHIIGRMAGPTPEHGKTTSWRAMVFSPRLTVERIRGTIAMM